MKNSNYVLFIFALFLLLLISRSAYAQIGTEFWFVAPEVTSEHKDTPVAFRITALDKDAHVTISMPKNNAFSNVNLTIPANTQVTQEFANVNMFENKPAAQINDKGILITSDNEITAYYEVIAQGLNPDKFTLKGENALGNDFFIPSQNIFQNHPDYSEARERVDIVATEDDTQIEISLPNGVSTTNHPAGSSFSVTLQRGETYSLEAPNGKTETHLGGVHITSDKPIAVTISDDSIEDPNSLISWDLVGDQLIPVDLLGTEYVATNPLFNQNQSLINDDGRRSNNIHKLFVLATRDNTYVSLNGVPSDVLNEGELAEYTIAATSDNVENNAIFIESSQPVYAYQLSGLEMRDQSKGYELGSAVLPSITCTGSSSVSFSRTMTDRFFVQIMTQYKNINYFKMTEHPDTGGSNDVTNKFLNLNEEDWFYVKGTGNKKEDNTWYTTSMAMDISTGGASYTIYNINPNSEKLFHLSILDENKGSMSFGYFSNYSRLRIKGPTLACEGTSITLTTTAPMKAYEWHSKQANGIIGTGPTLEISEPGKYWLDATVNNDGCVLTDSIDVNFTKPDFDLGNDTIVCPGELVTYNIDPSAGDSFLWLPDNITTPNYSVTPVPEDTVKVKLTITTKVGDANCAATDSVQVIGRTAPEIAWNITGSDVCLGDTIKTTTKMDKYEWSIDGQSVANHDEPYIIATTSGIYKLTVWTDKNCSETDSLDLTVHQPPSVAINDMGVCPGGTGTYTLSGYNTYLWENTTTTLSTQNSVNLTSSDSVFVTVTDNYGCVGSDDAYFEVYNQQVFSFGTDTSVCINNPITIKVDDQFSNYQWTFSLNGTGPKQTLATANHIYSIANATKNDEGEYTITATDNVHGCPVEGSFSLTVQDVPPLDIRDEEHICHGDTIKIETQDHRFTSFEWTLDTDPGNVLSTDSYVLVANAGTYQLTAWQDNGCSAAATSDVLVWDSPSFQLPDTVSSCPGSNISVDMLAGTWSSPQAGTDADPRNYSWSTGSPRAVYSNDKTLTTSNPGTYYLTAEDALCFFTDSVKVFYYESTKVTLDDAESCDNTPYTLTIPDSLKTKISPSGSYFWSRSGTSLQGPADSNWDVTSEGSYTLNITDNNGCQNSGSLALKHLKSPVFSLGTDRDKCDGDTIKIETQPSFTRYEWNGNTADGQNNYIETTGSGTYDLKVWAENGCSSEESVAINVNPLPNVDLGVPDISICAGETTTLSVSGYVTGSDTIYWSTGAQDQTEVEVSQGNYWVKLIDANGCVGKDEINVHYYDLPQVDLGDKDIQICPIDYPITIEAQVPNGANYTFIWHNNMTTRSITADLMDTLNTVIVTDEHGCQRIATKAVRAKSPPIYSLGNDTSACEPLDLVIDAGSEIVSEYLGEQIITPIYSYQWKDGSASQTDTVSESGSYWVTIFDGCAYTSDTIDVGYFPAPEITRLDTIYYAQVTVLAENGTIPYSYGLDNENNLQPENTFKEVENGEHTVYVVDNNGCEASKMFSLSSQYEIDVPKFFTPNNDGYNDTWTIEGLERLPDSSVSIFDRYGKLLRKFKASETVSWDGEYLNKPVPSDDYWYVIHLQPINKLLKGNVTVKR